MHVCSFFLQYCHSVVNSGEFSMDDANEVYCSLCGDGGEIVLCDFCNKSFCYACIERISGKGYLKKLLESETTEFKCYVCDSELLRSARELCRELTEHLKRSKCAQLRANTRKTRLKKDVEEHTTKVEENANSQESSGKPEDSEAKESENPDKEKTSTRKKVAITPAEVEDSDSDSDSDSSHNEGKSPEVQTDDIMSDTDLCEELARRKQKSKDAERRKEKPSSLDPVDPTSGTSDAQPEDSSGKQKVRKKKRTNILAGYSSEEEKETEDIKKPPKKMASISSDSSDSSDTEVDNKEKESKSKRNKRSRMASYSSDSDTKSHQHLQLQLSSDSSEGQGDERADARVLRDSSAEPVEYRIPDTHSHSDSSLTSDIEPMQRKKRKRDPLKTLTSSDDGASVKEKPSKMKNRRSMRRKKGSTGSERDSDDFMDEGPFLKGLRRRRRQRIKNLLTSESESESGSESGKESSDEEDDEEDEDELTESQDPKGKKRKKIRKLIVDTKLASETKKALQEEKERAERLKKRKKVATEEVEDRLVLEQDPKSKEVKLEVRKALVPNILPHQRDGIKFLYDACVESLERVAAGRGTGAILAHCMGLGKTLQVRTRVYVVKSVV